MSISILNYVKITSGVGGGAVVATRQFIGNVFTTNSLVDPLVPLQFPNAASVGAYFGTTSEEYLRAVQYFGYVSPSIRTPQNLLFSRYVNAASPCSIFGALQAFSLSVLNTITAGTITFNFNGLAPVTVTGINLAGAASMSAVAAALQTAFRLNASPYLTTCSVTYNAVTSSFNFQASNSAVIQGLFSLTQAGTGLTDLALQLGWYSTNGAVVVSSSPVVTPLQAVQNMVGISNNFGSFCFTTASATTLAQIQAVAAWNATLNVMFQYHVMVSLANSTTWSAALISVSGVALTYENDTLIAAATQWPEMIPMSILSAIDYTQRNGVQNFMYKTVPGVSPSVVTDTQKAALDALRINYVGQTQTAGQQLSFYQNGVMCGLAVTPQFMNIFSNEQWFKDYTAAGLMNLMLALPQLSANAGGIAQIMIVLQSAISQALFNGVVSVGKQLTTLQQIYITQQTGDNNAWLQVQNSGFWFNCTVAPTVDNISGLTIYNANYTVIYSKNDAVRAIIGTHALI